MLYTQLKAKAIDPDTTILAALGQHYVMTIKQWMRLYEWGSYPRATKYFKELKDNDLIYRKDREGRGGTLAQGDWFFLLNKGAHELQKRKQANPPFSLEPNEAEKASGDTLFHTSLVNELLIHLRLLERSHPDLFQIAGIDHERSMRRNYLAALGSDTRLYPDGFLRLLVPTSNGLKRRHLFLELQHTTQKDKHNWQTKVRKYLNLFDRPNMLEKFFATRTPQVLVITMDEAFVAYHKAWTEEVLAEIGDKGRGYSNRFLFGAYDKGIADMSVTPAQFFCTPRYSQPFQKAASPLFDL
jgi:Replication-relaxation